MFVAVWLGPFRLPRWRAVTLGVVATAGFVGVSLAVAVPGAATGGIAAGLGWTVLLAAVVNQLAVTRRQSAELAAARVLAERQRLAREIHDILAHSLSAQVVHLEGTRMLLDRDGDRAVALARVTQAGAMARAGLEETKRAVAALRGEPLPLAEELGRPVPRGHRKPLCGRDIRGPVGARRRGAARGRAHRAGGAHERAQARAPRVGHAGTALLGGELSAGPCDSGFRVLLRVPA